MFAKIGNISLFLNFLFPRDAYLECISEFWFYIFPLYCFRDESNIFFRVYFSGNFFKYACLISTAMSEFVLIFKTILEKSGGFYFKVMMGMR